MTTVLITGANRGVGLALVKAYAAENSRVIATCRDPAAAADLKALAASSRGQVRVLQLDQSSEVSIQVLKRVLGAEPIDVLLINGAINGTPKDQTALRIDGENYIHTMRVNALGPLLLSQALRANLLAGKTKKLVAISSAYGSVSKEWDRTVNAHERYAYRGSKAALNSGMRALSRDWKADGVVVGIIDPGWVRTDMGGKGAVESSSSITAETSANGIKDRIAQLDLETTGTFQRFWGETIPW